MSMPRKYIVLSSLLFAICLLIVACSGQKPNQHSSQTTHTSTSSKTSSSNEKPSDPIPPAQIAKAKEIIASVDEAAVTAVDAKAKFRLFCATCHGMKGNLSVNGARDLTKADISLEENVAMIYHGKGLMTPFQNMLKPAEMVAIARYVKTLRTGSSQ